MCMGFHMALLLAKSNAAHVRAEDGHGAISLTCAGGQLPPTHHAILTLHSACLSL